MTTNRMLVTSEAQSIGRATFRLLLDSGSNSVVLIGAASGVLGSVSEANGNLGVVGGELSMCGSAG